MEQLYYGTTDFEVAEFRNRKAIDEIKMVMTVFDCVLPDNSAVYCSSDVTTGKQLYNIFRKYDVCSDKDLREKLGESRYEEIRSDLIQRNIKRGNEFTENIRQRGGVNLINPGPFMGSNFEQEHYYYLWEWVIIRKVYEAQFNKGWEYSTGCTLEYAIATKKGIPRLDHLGNILDLQQAIDKVEKAVADLRASRIQAKGLERNLGLMKEIQ